MCTQTSWGNLDSDAAGLGGAGILDPINPQVVLMLLVCGPLYE